MNNSFLTNVDEEKVNSVVTTTEENSKEFTNISDNLVKAHTEELDKLMSNLWSDVVKDDASDITLEKYSLELSNMLYFMGQKLENIGVKDDLSKLAAKEVYNEAYLNAPLDEKGKKPTVAELTAVAENESRYETIMNMIYSRVYKQIKFKIDAGYDMLSTLRKIISKRMQETQLSMIPRMPGGSVIISSEGE